MLLVGLSVNSSELLGCLDNSPHFICILIIAIQFCNALMIIHVLFSAINLIYELYKFEADACKKRNAIFILDLSYQTSHSPLYVKIKSLKYSSIKIYIFLLVISILVFNVEFVLGPKTFVKNVNDVLNFKNLLNQ